MTYRAYAYVSLGAFLFACVHSSKTERGLSGDSVAGSPINIKQLDGRSLPDKTVALTFDDGPGPRTRELASFLQHEGIRATFFVLGNNVSQSGDATLAELQAEGHLVANHTFDHQDLTTLGDALVVGEVGNTHARIREFVDAGHFLLRAPYGAWNGRVAGALEASAYASYVGSVFWDVGGALDGNYAADWACWNNGLSVTDCGDRYVHEIVDRGGGIVLMHDIHSGSVDMAKYIVPVLKARGFTFARVDEVPEIAALLTGADPSVPPVDSSKCGDLDYYGRCNGNTVQWCQDRALRSRDCGADKACGLDPNNPGIGLTCVINTSPPVAAGCGSVTDYGRCTGSTLEWCDSGSLRSVNCADSGRLCGVDPDPNMGLNCISQ